MDFAIKQLEKQKKDISKTIQHIQCNINDLEESLKQELLFLNENKERLKSVYNAIKILNGDQVNLDAIELSKIIFNESMNIKSVTIAKNQCDNCGGQNE